jgi:ribosomal-protein-alanine N-acetyltransferase
MKKNNGTVSVEIRKLQHADEVRKCAWLMANCEPWKTLRRSYDDSVRILNDPLKEVHLAVTKDEIVGFVIIQMSGAFTGYIQMVAVMPKWRNKGIGSKLIKFAENRIFRKKPNVFMCVSSFNKKAQKLYNKLGYEIVGELKGYIISGHSEILLRKTIAPLTEFKTSP